MLATAGTISSGILSGGLDSDASAFISAAGITNIQERYAINKVVLDAKGHSWWTLCNAIYPMVGGTATTHKFNLKDPQDTDAAFRLNFQGTWVHSSTGADPDGSTAYADTFLIPSSVLTLNDTHISIYNRTESNGVYCDIGVISDGSNNGFLMYTLDGNFQSDQYRSLERLSVANTSSMGWLLSSRTSSTVFAGYRDGTSLGSTGTTTGGLPTADFILCAVDNNGSIIQFSPRECAFATIGAGISSTIAAIMYQDIQNFQRRLNRAV